MPTMDYFCLAGSPKQAELQVANRAKQVFQAVM